MTFRDIHVTLDDGSVLHAQVHDGDSVPLVLLHDLDCSLAYWEPMIERLLARDPGLTIVNVDMRGHGGSTCAGETSRKRLVKDLRKFTKALSLEDVVLCGHGWGADVALAADCASSVIAINPLFGREADAFPADAPRGAALAGAVSGDVLESCRVGVAQAKRLRRSRRDAPLLLITADPLDHDADAYPEIAEAAVEAYAWQDGSRHLPWEAPAGIAALVCTWIEEVA